jgi:hypothetical protein
MPAARRSPPEPSDERGLQWDTGEGVGSGGGEGDEHGVCCGCRWLFVDESRNMSRRWCTMEECGTHEKVRRYLERRAARRKRG